MKGVSYEAFRLGAWMVCFCNEFAIDLSPRDAYFSDTSQGLACVECIIEPENVGNHVLRSLQFDTRAPLRFFEPIGILLLYALESTTSCFHTL